MDDHEVPGRPRRLHLADRMRSRAIILRATLSLIEERGFAAVAERALENLVREDVGTAIRVR